MAGSGQRPTRLATWIGLAVLAGAAAGLVAVYVSGGFHGNGAAVAVVDCGDALRRAPSLEPLVKGEVAAFRPADRADDLSSLAFRKPDGSAATLGEAFAGRTVLVNLWATWCVPCRKEMPSLDRLETDLSGDRFSVAAINIDIGEAGQERARAFLDEIAVHKLAFLSDPTTGVFKELKSRGLALGLPTTVLVDGRGCRLGVLEGPAAWDSEEAKALVRAAAGLG